MLGHGLGVDALPAGPGAPVVEQARRRELLHAGPQQLHPPDVGCVDERCLQGLDGVGVEPHQRLGVVDLDHAPAALRHRLCHPVGDGIGPEGDGRRGHGSEG